MTAYYKATRENGRDFYSGKIDYAAALESGKPVVHPGVKGIEFRDSTFRGVRANDFTIPAAGAATYLSVSVSAADCTGFSWPARLFEVEPVDPWTPDAQGLPNKRACLSLTVVRELPSWQVFGPNGEAVVRLIEAVRGISPDQARKLAAAGDATWGIAQYAASAVADAAVRAAASAVVSAVAWEAASAVARTVAWEAACDATAAAVSRDLITPEQYQILAGPWESIMGPILGGDA